MKKRLLLVVVLAVALALVMAVPALAKSGDVKGKLVLNITYKVTNDEDGGPNGYWALNDYNLHIQVWQTGPNSFHAVLSYAGMWHTFAGALSPTAGITQGHDASGPLKGLITLTFDADEVNPDHLKAFGYIGKFDFGGTKADILLGTYDKQTGITNFFDSLGNYFPGLSVNSGEARFTYHYRNQVLVLSSAGNSGDIVIP